MTVEKAKKVISVISFSGIIASILLIISGAFLILNMSLGNNFILDLLGITAAEAGDEFLKIFNFYQVYIGVCLLIFGAIFWFVFEKLRQYHNWARWFLVSLAGLCISVLIFAFGWITLLIIPLSFLLLFLIFFDEIDYVFNEYRYPNHRKNLRIKRMIHAYHETAGSGSEQIMKKSSKKKGSGKRVTKKKKRKTA